MSKALNHILAAQDSYIPSVTLASIAVTTPPDYIVYNIGDSFDPMGMVVTATYSDGTTAPVNGYTISYDFTITGFRNVTITYIEGGITCTATIDYIVVYGIISTLPSQSLALTYTGTAQSPTWTGYNPAALTISGTQQATGAGTYTVTFEPAANSGYMWWDNSTGPKNVTWTINKAKGTPTVNAQSINLTSGSLTFTLSISRADAGPGAISVISSDPTKCTVTSLNSTSKTITGKATGSASIEIYVAESTNYLESYHVTIPVTVSLAPTAKMPASADKTNSTTTGGKYYSRPASLGKGADALYNTYTAYEAVLTPKVEALRSANAEVERLDGELTAQGDKLKKMSAVAKQGSSDMLCYFFRVKYGWYPSASGAEHP